MTESVITKYFVQDHKVLDELANTFFESKKNNLNFTDKYNDLKNSLKRHFLQEEILYNSYSGKEGEFLNKITQILNQHKLILDLLEEIYESENDFENNIIVLSNLLIEHKLLEEKYVYVKFDEVLNEKEKSGVIKDLELYSKESKSSFPY